MKNITHFFSGRKRSKQNLKTCGHIAPLLLLCGGTTAHRASKVLQPAGGRQVAGRTKIRKCLILDSHYTTGPEIVGHQKSRASERARILFRIGSSSGNSSSTYGIRSASGTSQSVVVAKTACDVTALWYKLGRSKYVCSLKGRVDKIVGYRLYKTTPLILGYSGKKYQ